MNYRYDYNDIILGGENNDIPQTIKTFDFQKLYN